MAQTQTIGSHRTSVSTNMVGDTSVTYHGTAVVIFNSEEISLDSGGWRTSTTKNRMNQASNQFNLGFGVFQKNFEWFVDFNGETLEFKDGMVLNRV